MGVMVQGRTYPLTPFLNEGGQGFLDVSSLRKTGDEVFRSISVFMPRRQRLVLLVSPFPLGEGAGRRGLRGREDGLLLVLHYAFDFC